MAAWAEQGYIIVCPNITGSVGYGLEFARSMTWLILVLADAR